VRPSSKVAKKYLKSLNECFPLILCIYVILLGDIGISFAAADAALSAPFSSRGESISCVEKILLEGNTNIRQSYVTPLICKYLSHTLFPFPLGRCSKQINVEILLVMVAENLVKYIGVMVLLQEASNYSSF